MTSFDAVIALGSNMGDKAANIAHALDLLGGGGEIRVIARSSLYRTRPWGVTDQDWFVNACAGVETELGANDLLGRCQAVEREMGRVRALKWGPRLIDLDIIVHGQGAVATPELVLPHPRAAERAFVLVPLADFAPDLQIGGARVRDLLARVDRSGVERLPS